MSSKTEDLIPHEQIMLEQHKFATRIVMSPEAMEFEQYRDLERNQIVKTFQLKILGTHRKNLIIVYPKDWWQAFKERWLGYKNSWMPIWIKRMFPVVYTRHDINSMQLFPEIPVPIKDKYLVINYWENNESDRKY